MAVAWRRGVDFVGRKACTARRRGMLSVKKSRQKNFGAEFVIAFGGAESLEDDGLYGSPPGDAFCEEE